MRLGLTFIDGNFTALLPDGPPDFHYPLRGDSVFSARAIVFWNANLNPPKYDVVPLGTNPNIQPWSAAQCAMVIEQHFIIHQSAYQSIRLNTPYDPNWALDAAYDPTGVLGWPGCFPDNQPTVNLANCYLVEIGELEGMPGGLLRMRLRFASLPPTRNEIEQFSYHYRGLNWLRTTPAIQYDRQSFQLTVPSRVQYDYYIFDDYGILGLPVFPDGNKLSATTGLYPPGLILPAQYYYMDSNSVASNTFLPDDGQLSATTIPSAEDYLNFITANDYYGQPVGAELVAETSTLDRWMGNIFVRRTRFVPVI